MQNSMVVSFIRFRLEIPFVDKLDPKTQNCQFKLKFGTLTTSNMQNSLVVFFVLDRTPWANLDNLGKFGQIWAIWANLVGKAKLLV